MVVATCVFSYAVHARTHFDDADSTLVRTAQHVALEVARAPRSASWSHVLEASRLLETSVRLYDRSGRLIAQSDHGSPIPAFTPLTNAETPSPRPYSWIVAAVPAVHGQRAPSVPMHMLTSATQRWRVHVTPVDGTTLQLAAFRSLAHLDESVERFGRLMLFMALTGAMVSWALGWLVAGRALRPIAILTEAARSIASAGTFSRRVPDAGSGDELGRLARVFNAMLASLEKAYESQQRFIADASHEMRAPLAVIGGNMELLQKATRLPEAERQAAIDESRQECERLARLVTDLLTLARADARVAVRRGAVELDRVFLKVFGDVRRLAHGQRMELGLVTPCIVAGDEDRLTQLILILLDNAIRYTPAGGLIKTSLVRSDDRVCLEVADAGIGIAEHDLPHIFDRFFRADPARSRDPGGTGLGLSIARWIATQHDGDVEITSALGRGTVVRVRLPTSSFS